MKLYFHPASTTSRIVQLFAVDQGIDLEYALVNLFTGEHMQDEFRSVNPSGLVPVLEDGDFRLSESSAIVKYLADKVGSPAYPKELKARARVNELMDWFNSNFYKDISYGLAYPQTFPNHKRDNDTVQAGILAWGKQKTESWLTILDEKLIGPNKKYVCGDQITLADYLGIEMVLVGELIRCDFAQYPNVDRWINNMKSIKSWGKVHEVFDGFKASLKDKEFVAV